MAHVPIEIKTLARGPQERIVESKRFAILVLGSMGCICTSLSYAFNLITDTMVERYGFTQRDISTISTVGLVFKYVNLPYAVIYDWLGPIIPCVLACTFLPLGNLLYALTFRGTIAGSVVKLSVFNAFTSAGCIIFDLIALVTVLAHFPSNRGPVVALLKTFTGLGSAIVGCLYLGFFNGNTEPYFYFLVGFSVLVGVLCIIFMRLPVYHLTGWQRSHLPEDEKQKRLTRKAQYLKQRPQIKRFIHGFSCLIFLIAFLPLQSALIAYLKLGRNEKIGFACVVVFVMAVYLLVAAPLPWYRDRAQEEKERQHDEEQGAVEEAVEDGLIKDADGAVEVDDRSVDERVGNANDKVIPETEVDFMAPQYPNSFLRNLLAPDLWCFFWTLFCILGTTNMVTFNATYMYGALAGQKAPASVKTLLTVFNGVGSAIGRLCLSAFEVLTQKRPAEKRIPITFALYPPACSLIITLVLFLALRNAALLLPFALSAFSDGFLSAGNVIMSHTVFAKDHAKHYNFLYLASFASAVCTNRFLYGEWYSVQAEKMGVTVCYKFKCVVLPLAVCLGLACSAFLSSTILNIRYHRYCKRVLAERRRLRLEAMGETTTRGAEGEEPFDEIEKEIESSEHDYVGEGHNDQHSRNHPTAGSSR